MKNNRRDFLKVATVVGAGAMTGGVIKSYSAGTEKEIAGSRYAQVSNMSGFSEAWTLQNFKVNTMTNNLQLVKWARDAGLAKSCLRQHRIYDYEPGHVRYQFGHYPSRKPYHPTEMDWKLLDIYCENGLGVVHVWWWSDMSGFFGKGVFEPINEPGLRQFIDECHRRKLKVIPYVSPGYMDINSPTYRPEWSRGIGHLREVFYDLDMLCPGSPGVRANFFSTIDRLMDDYGFDGLYCDGGVGLHKVGCVNQNHDNHIHFLDIPSEKKADVSSLDDKTRDKVHGAFVDLWNEFFSEIYSHVKKRGGLVVAHVGADDSPPFSEKCWDYHLIGECVNDALASVDKTKLFDPYVLRFNDWSQLITNRSQGSLTPNLELVPKIEHLSMAASIPYLQFPWLEDGCYGENEDIFNLSGIPWKKERDHWIEWMKEQQKVGLPPIMGASFAAGRDRYLRYLRIYRQMTEENTIAYLEIKAKKENRFPVTEAERCVSVFVNNSLWVAIGWLGTETQKVLVRSLKGSDKGEIVRLLPGTLTVLRYGDLISPPEVLKFSAGDTD